MLLDNRRSRIRVDEELLDTLRCIRCGTCINYCPVYVQLGATPTAPVYPGPIGIALEPQRIGIDKVGTLTSACTMCGACGEVCPVKIPAAQTDQPPARGGGQRAAHHHPLLGQGSLRKPGEATIWKLWQQLYASAAVSAVHPRCGNAPALAHPRKLGGWTRYPSAPRRRRAACGNWPFARDLAMGSARQHPRRLRQPSHAVPAPAVYTNHWAGTVNAVSPNSRHECTRCAARCIGCTR